MNKFYYDFHIHSCLSPCADDDMTAGNIAGMAFLKGLDIIALTDHNTLGNCPPFFNACEREGLIPVSGVELTTAEEIHIVCLFENLDDGRGFEDFITPHRSKIPNFPEIYGEQLLLGDNDSVLGKHPYLLSDATDLTLEAACRGALKHGGIVFPAHIERPAGGILGVLGFLPDELPFGIVEINSRNFPPDTKTNPALKAALPRNFCLKNSDAHRLWEINEADKINYVNCIELPAERGDREAARRELFRLLRKTKKPEKL